MPINLSQVYGGGGGIGFINTGVSSFNGDFGQLRVTVNHTTSLQQRLTLSGRYRIFGMRLITHSIDSTGKAHRVRIDADGSTLFDVSRNAGLSVNWGFYGGFDALVRGLFFDVETSIQIYSSVASNPGTSTWELVVIPLR